MKPLIAEDYSDEDMVEELKSMEILVGGLSDAVCEVLDHYDEHKNICESQRALLNVVWSKI